MQKFGEKEIEKYSSFVDGLFINQLKSGFAKKQNEFDIRPLIKAGDMLIYDNPMDICQNALMKGKAQTVLNTLDFLNEMVIHGNGQVKVFFHDNE